MGGRKASQEATVSPSLCFIVSEAEYAFFHEGNFSIPTGSISLYFNRKNMTVTLLLHSFHFTKFSSRYCLYLSNMFNHISDRKLKWKNESERSWNYRRRATNQKPSVNHLKRKEKNKQIWKCQRKPEETPCVKNLEEVVRQQGRDLLAKIWDKNLFFFVIWLWKWWADNSLVCPLYCF